MPIWDMACIAGIAWVRAGFSYVMARQTRGGDVRYSPIVWTSAQRDAVPAGPHPAPPDHLNRTTTCKESVMKFLNTLLSTLVLSLALAGAAIAGETVNINSADAATLDRVLVNIGPSKAQAIVEYRKAHGAFRSAEQLAEVKGVGLKTVEKNRDRISLGGTAPARPAATASRPQQVASAQPKPVARR